MCISGQCGIADVPFETIGEGTDILPSKSFWRSSRRENRNQWKGFTWKGEKDQYHVVQG